MAPTTLHRDPLDESPAVAAAQVAFRPQRLPAMLPPPASNTAPPTRSAAPELQQLAALLDLVARLQSAASPRDAARRLAMETATFFSAARVVVGLCRTPQAACEVVAVSDLDTFAPHDETIRHAQGVLLETVARGELSVWPPLAGQTRHALLAHRQYADFAKASRVLGSPLRDSEGRTLGAWFVALPADAESEASATTVRQFMAAAEPSLSAALQLLQRAQRHKLIRGVAEMWSTVTRWKTIAALLAAASVAGALCVPTTCHVTCSCTLEPVVRRFVAAPFAGPLERTFVEPGDIVTRDQLLAQMDGREVRWELAGVQAELHRAAKERVGHMTTHDTGKAEITRHEVERLKLRQELLTNRDAHLQIRSPIDGMVVSGDLKRVEGMPLSVGQNLFEIAPLDEMVVEVAIPEADIEYVQPGMSVAIRLDSHAFAPRTATVQRIQPRAEIRDNENVFLAEVRLTNETGELRPGMKGEARIAAGQYSLGWNLLRKPLAAALAWLGW